MGGSVREVSVRAATQADVAVIGRLGASLVRLHHEFDPRRFMAATPHTEEGYGKFIGTQIDEPDVIVLVAERAGAVVGYAYAAVEGIDYMSLRGPAGVLHDVVVDSGHRGQGIGRMLLDAALEALEARGVPRVVLNAAEQNETARKLFASAGFRPTMVEMTRERGGAR
jgi:ribosomal protein S18 acetylase RimI-like enzyme